MGKKIAMPFIRTGVGVQAPRWPFVLNEDSPQAENLFAWYPAQPVTPGRLVDMSLGVKRDLIFVTANEPILDTHKHGGPSVRYAVSDEARFDAAADIDEVNTVDDLSLTGWFQPVVPRALNFGFTLMDKNDSDRWILLQNQANGTLAYNHHNFDKLSGSHAAVGATVVPDDGMPHFAVGLDLSAGDFLEVFLDGVFDGSSSNDTNSRRFIDRISMGRLSDTTPSNTGNGHWWDTRVYLSRLSRPLIRQMFEPDTRYDLYEEYGQKTFFDMRTPNEGHHFPIPYIKRNVGVQAPRWPFVLNEGSRQAENLFAWWPANPVTPGRLIDMSPGVRHDLTFLGGGAEPALDTSLLGGPSVRFVTSDRAHFQGAGLGALNGNGNLCLSGWFETNNLGLINLGPHVNDPTFSNTHLWIAHRPDVAGNPVQAFHQDFVGGGDGNAVGSTDTDDNNPHFIMGKYLGATDTRVYLDGIQDGNDTTSHGARGSIDTIGVGSVQKLSPLNTGNGSWWDVRIYTGDVHDAVVRQMFEPDTRYDLFEEYGRKTYIDFGGPPLDLFGSEVVQPMMTIINQ